MQASKEAIIRGHPSSWAEGFKNWRTGLNIFSARKVLYLQMALTFSLPAIVAGIVTEAFAPSGVLWGITKWVLVGIALSYAPVVVMKAARRSYDREPCTFAGASKEAAPWLPRYLWTNLHTTIIFWVPVQGLTFLGHALLAVLPADGAVRIICLVLLGATLSATALYLHTRTMLAPYLAIHSDLPGTIATYESWRISGRHFRQIFLVFVLGTVPIVLPMVAIIYWLMFLTGSTDAVMSSGSLLTLLSVNIVAAAVIVQWTRPLLVPAAHALYVDLWQKEQPKGGFFMNGGLPWIVSPVFLGSELLFSQLRRIPRLGTYWHF